MTHEVVVTNTDPVAINDDSTMSDIRAAFNDKPVEKPVVEPETAATEVEEKTTEVEAKPEAESEPADKKTEPEVIEEELPEGVKKRIAKEAEKQARIQSEINRAISARKAKEEELKQLSGSEPVQNTEKPSDRPVRPKPDAYNTWGEYLAADEKYATEHEAWLQSETRRTVEQEFTARQAAAESKRAFDEALKAHGDLREMADTVIEGSPEPLQLAISALNDWAGVTVHLGKNPEELAALVQKFQSNPYGALADLGKLEARLTSSKEPEKTEKPAEKPLPAPPAQVGGRASASAPKVDLEKADDATFMRELRRLKKAG